MGARLRIVWVLLGGRRAGHGTEDREVVTGGLVSARGKRRGEVRSVSHCPFESLDRRGGREASPRPRRRSSRGHGSCNSPGDVRLCEEECVELLEALGGGEVGEGNHGHLFGGFYLCRTGVALVSHCPLIRIGLYGRLSRAACSACLFFAVHTRLGGRIRSGKAAQDPQCAFSTRISRVENPLKLGRFRSPGFGKFSILK